MTIKNGKDQNTNGAEKGTWRVKAGLAQMLKGGVIMDVVTPEHAKIAEDAGACAVMALERVPADIRAQGGVARMSDPGLIEKIMETVSIPVMAKVRIGHFVEAQILEALGVDSLWNWDHFFPLLGDPDGGVRRVAEAALADGAAAEVIPLLIAAYETEPIDPERAARLALLMTTRARRDFGHDPGLDAVLPSVR